jgi:hypothetical protein
VPGSRPGPDAGDDVIGEYAPAVADVLTGEVVTLTPGLAGLVDPGLPEDLAALSREELAEQCRRVLQFAGQAVQFGARAEGLSQWALGDLALEVVSRSDEADLKNYAAEIGLNYNALKGYSATSAAFPPDVGRQTQVFSVFQTLNAQPDRLEWSRGTA